MQTTELNQPPGAAAAPFDLDAELAAIPTMTWDDLRRRWCELTGRPVPRVRAALLRPALAWELQARRYGGVSQRTEQYLERFVKPVSLAKPGLKLVREWRGVLHTVEVDNDKVVHWNDQQWRSLSEVARAITGTRWSGPAFFGLKPKVAA